MKTIKSIDIKSLIIGVLAVSLVFACTDSNNKTTNSPTLVSNATAADASQGNPIKLRLPSTWNENQVWEVQKERNFSAGKLTAGWEPFAVTQMRGKSGNVLHFRKRIK